MAELTEVRCKDMITLYQKAAAIAIKLEQLDKELLLRPEWVLRRATAEEIDFYYAKMCKGV